MRIDDATAKTSLRELDNLKVQFTIFTVLGKVAVSVHMIQE